MDGGGLAGVLAPSDQAERQPGGRRDLPQEPLAFGLVGLLQYVAEDDQAALAILIGWEAFIVLYDVRGLTTDQARAVITDTTLALLDAAIEDAVPG
ncbi:MAG TPA: hypothetical protein VGI96_35245 [Streptosporangiaceae bacterium]